MLNAVILSVVRVNVLLNAIILTLIVLNAVILIVVRVNVIPNVIQLCHYAECRYTECH